MFELILGTGRRLDNKHGVVTPIPMTGITSYSRGSMVSDPKDAHYYFGLGVDRSTNPVMSVWKVNADTKVVTKLADIPNEGGSSMYAYLGIAKGVLWAFLRNYIYKYDPVVNTWTRVRFTDDSQLWSYGGQCLTWNDDIYMVGQIRGSNSNFGIVKVDTTAMTLTQLTTIPGVFNSPYGAAAMVGDKVYATGNVTTGTKIVSVYDFAANTWETLNFPVLFESNPILAGCGDLLYYRTGRHIRDFNVYDTVKKTHRPLRKLPRATFEAAYLVKDDLLYVQGGSSTNNPADAVSDTFTYGLYDSGNPPRLTDEWSSLPDLAVDATQGHSVTVIDNLAYIYGGTFAGTTLLRSLNLDTGEVKTLKAGSTARTRHTAVAIGRKIYFYGGYSGSAYIGTLHSYDVDTDTWVTNLTAGAISDRHAAGVLNGRMYASGGTADKTPVPTNLREYNPTTDRWTNIQSGHGGDPLGGVTVDNEFYIIGGLNAVSGQQFKKVSGTDIATTTFLPGVADNRHSMAVAAAKQGIYLFGGYQLGAAATALVQRYDIATQLWTTLKPMPIPVGERGAAVSYKNKIYLIGGNGTAAKKVQVYTP